MATYSIDKIKYGDNVYQLKDNTSGWTKNTGTVTNITAGAGLNTSSNDSAADGGSVTTTGTIHLTKSGVTASSYGEASAKSPGYSGTFSVPKITVDKYGRVTAAENVTITLPASDNVDTKVNVKARGTTKAYLLGTTTAPTSSNQAVESVAETGVYFDTTAGKLVATTFVGSLTGTASGNLTSSSSLNAGKLSGTIPSGVTATTQSAGDNSTKLATTAYVDSAMTSMSGPMRFIGTLGTGGTATSLPAAAAENKGHSYKVITAGTYQSVAAKVGDMLVSDGSAWILIPSGDEPSGTVTSVTLKAGSGIALDTDNTAITTSGSRTISHADTSSQASISASGRTYVTGVTLDTYGHVTGLTTGTETVTNTDTKVQVAEGVSATTYYPIFGTGTTAATRQYDTAGFVYVPTTGTTSAVGTAALTLGNSTASGTANNKKGQLVLYGSTAKKITIEAGDIAADKTINLAGNTASAITGVSVADHATTSIGSASGWSAGSASNWVFENVTVPIRNENATTVPIAASSATSIPNVTSVGSASTWVFEEKEIPNVTSVGTAPSLTITTKKPDDITAWSAGSGTASLTFAMDTTDTNQLNISFSHTHTAPTLTYSEVSVGSASNWSAGTTPTLGTAISVQSKKSGGNGTAPTLGTAISVTGVSGSTTVYGVQSGDNSTTTASHVKSGGNGTAPSLTVTSKTVVTGKTHTVTDNGHSHAFA